MNNTHTHTKTSVPYNRNCTVLRLNNVSGLPLSSLRDNCATPRDSNGSISNAFKNLALVQYCLSPPGHIAEHEDREIPLLTAIDLENCIRSLLETNSCCQLYLVFHRLW